MRDESAPGGRMFVLYGLVKCECLCVCVNVVCLFELDRWFVVCVCVGKIVLTTCGGGYAVELDTVVLASMLKLELTRADAGI